MIYIVCEGQGGFRKRVAAYKAKYKLSDLDFHFIEARPNLGVHRGDEAGPVGPLGISGVSDLASHAGTPPAVRHPDAGRERAAISRASGRIGDLRSQWTVGSGQWAVGN